MHTKTKRVLSTVLALTPAAAAVIQAPPAYATTGSYPGLCSGSVVYVSVTSTSATAWEGPPCADQSISMNVHYKNNSTGATSTYGSGWVATSTGWSAPSGYTITSVDSWACQDSHGGCTNTYTFYP